MFRFNRAGVIEVATAHEDPEPSGGPRHDVHRLEALSLDATFVERPHEHRAFPHVHIGQLDGFARIDHRPLSTIELTEEPAPDAHGPIIWI